MREASGKKKVNRVGIRKQKLRKKEMREKKKNGRNTVCCGTARREETGVRISGAEPREGRSRVAGEG